MGIFKKFWEEIKRLGRGIKSLRFFELSDAPRVKKSFSGKERLAFILLASIFAADLAAIAGNFYLTHTKTVPANGGIYAEGVVGQPTYVNPLLASSQTDKDITKLVYAGLYKYDSQGNMVPDLAEGDAQISKDGKQYSISLKPGLKWSDGQPITTDDIIFTIGLAQNPAYNIPAGQAWQNITLKKIDDLNLVLANKFVSAPFLSNLTLGILPKHIWSGLSPQQFQLAKYNLEPITNGPFFIKEIRKTANGEIQNFLLESYANYWQGKPLLDNIQINFYNNYQDALFALHSRQIQGFGYVPFSEKVYVEPGKSSLQILKSPLYEYQAVFFNLAKSHKVLGDAAVRTALAKSVNRPDIINNVYFGMANPAYGPIMPGQLGYNPDVEKINSYDIAAANDILDKAGWIKDPQTGIRSKSGQLLQFSITTNDFVLNSQTADLLKSQWQKIGADLSVNVVPTAQLTDGYIRPRNFDALLFAESTGADPDPFVFWHSSQAANPGFNIAQYKNTATDALISAARVTFDSASRIKDYQQFQTILANDVPAIFLDQSLFVYQISPTVQGITGRTLANPEDRFYDVSHWYVQTKRVIK